MDESEEWAQCPVDAMFSGSIPSSRHQWLMVKQGTLEQEEKLLLLQPYPTILRDVTPYLFIFPTLDLVTQHLSIYLRDIQKFMESSSQKLLSGCMQGSLATDSFTALNSVQIR